MSVALVIVSHSSSLAAGVAELAGQMAPDVRIETAGGGDDGGLGTSFDKITAALDAALQADAAVVLYDLGSALLTTESAVEFLTDDDAARVAIVDAPLVEGAVAAAVEAQGGADLAAVAAAARNAVRSFVAPDSSSADSAGSPSDADSHLSRTVTLVNPLGLHARPAAELARAVGGFDAEVEMHVAGQEPVDVGSVLSLIALGVRGGTEVRLTATGPDAEAALDAVQTLIQGGFGETEQV